jgi:hypothetical protein
MTQKFSEELVLFDFSYPKIVAEWSSINDVVMGGLSEGGIRWEETGHLIFSGSVSLANNGGFASIKSLNKKYNLTGYKGIMLIALGDGKRYKFTARTDTAFDGVSYQQAFVSLPKKQVEYFLPFEAFLPSYHGKKLPDHSALDQSIIKRFGVIIADRQEGSFSLEIAKIFAVK